MGVVNLGACLMGVTIICGGVDMVSDSTRKKLEPSYVDNDVSLLTCKSLYCLFDSRVELVTQIVSWQHSSHKVMFKGHQSDTRL